MVDVANSTDAQSCASQKPSDQNISKNATY